jgi:ribose transport system substrate-binding protein
MKKLLTVMLLIMSTTIAACGDGESTRSPSGSGSTDNGVAEAKAFLSEYLKPPTSVGVTQPLSKKPPTGQTVVGLEGPLALSKVVASGWKAATETLGWTYKGINIGTDPEGIQKAFSSALSLNPAPNAIIVAGSPKSSYSAQLAEAKRRGIAVVSNSTIDTPGTGDGLIATVGGAPDAELAGKMIAAEVVADSDANAHVALFTVSAYPLLGSFTDSVKKNLSAWCPKCTVKVVDQQATDIGTRIPSSVVSTLQADQKLNYAVFAIGDMTTGVPPALKAAGLADRVKILGQLASAPNIESVAAGTEFAWTAFPAPSFGWTTVDAIARHSVGDDPKVSTDALAATMLLTKDTVKDLAQDEDGNFIGVVDYADQWKKLWHIDS